jgi:hypothetical protein
MSISIPTAKAAELTVTYNGTDQIPRTLNATASFDFVLGMYDCTGTENASSTIDFSQAAGKVASVQVSNNSIKISPISGGGSNFTLTIKLFVWADATVQANSSVMHFSFDDSLTMPANCVLQIGAIPSATANNFNQTITNADPNVPLFWPTVALGGFSAVRGVRD